VRPISFPNAFALDEASLSEVESILPTLLSRDSADALADSSSFAAVSDADDMSVSPAVLASMVNSIARSSSERICEARVSSFVDISLISPLTMMPNSFEDI
jgi:hypothetical protein